eukprot:970420-Pyramimonas_sp.AAC.1
MLLLLLRGQAAGVGGGSADALRHRPAPNPARPDPEGSFPWEAGAHATGVSADGRERLCGPPGFA